MSPAPALPAPFRPGDEVDVRIERLAYGGEAVGRAEGPDGRAFVLFVDRAVPGDSVRARVRRIHRRHAQAEVVAVAEPSADRVAPRCSHFSQGCGGCTWQHVDYQAQLAAKTAVVADSLERLGGFRDVPLQPIIAAPSPWYFRNRMDFAFNPEGGLGLHRPGAWDKIFTLEECFLQSPLSVRIVKEARAFATGRKMDLFDPRAHQGFLRELIIRHAVGTGETMVGIITSAGPAEALEPLADHLAALDPGITGVVHGVRASASEAAPLVSVRALRGKPEITELARGLRFRIALGTFFQTNTAQAEALMDLVRDAAADANGHRPGGGLAIDLYCGVGFFSLALAGQFADVAGIEIVPASIEAARANADANGIRNVSFHTGDARTALPRVLARHGAPRVLVLDPPRGGAGGKVMRRIARSQPERIIYVSCNPTTLARDLRELVPFGYRLTAVQPVDLFPQTYHVEVVVTLSKAHLDARGEIGDGGEVG